MANSTIHADAGHQLHFSGQMLIPIIRYIDLTDDIGIDHFFEFSE